VDEGGWRIEELGVAHDTLLIVCPPPATELHAPHRCHTEDGLVPMAVMVLTLVKQAARTVAQPQYGPALWWNTLWQDGEETALAGDAPPATFYR
jgi:hypothetical protein